MAGSRVACTLVAAVVSACGRLGFEAASDASGPGDGSGDSSGGGSAVAIAPADDFNDGTLAAFWNTYEDTAPGSTYAEVNGGLDITLATNVAGSYAGYVTATPYTLRDNAVTIELVQRANPILGGGCYLSLVTTDQSQSIDVGIESDGVSASQNAVAFATIPYGPETRWLRMRELGGTVLWQVSPDGVAWTTYATLARPGFVDAVTINLGGGTYNAVSGLGDCVFDNFDKPP
jgi:hypothetical protein